MSCETTCENASKKTCYVRSANYSLDVKCLQIFDGIMRTPGKVGNYNITVVTFLFSEFSFLIGHYNLLYQSIIPNCKLTINILKQHLKISSDAENFVISGESSRIRCQRIVNLLLLQLDKIKDYEQLCSLLYKISVVETLPDKLYSGIHTHTHTHTRTHACTHTYNVCI